MRSLILDSSIVICAAGNTLYEILSCARPAIVMCQARHQLLTAGEMEARTPIVNMGMGDKVSVKMLSKKISELLLRKDMRIKMSKLGPKISDGKGVVRVAEIILKKTRFGVSW
jgi:spore coat polysaccharide biosynthesis predicted glycosyltransferase SpsG